MHNLHHSTSSSSSSSAQYTYAANSYYSMSYQPPQPYVAPLPVILATVAPILGATVYLQPFGPVHVVYTYLQFQQYYKYVLETSFALAEVIIWQRDNKGKHNGCVRCECYSKAMAELTEDSSSHS